LGRRGERVEKAEEGRRARETPNPQFIQINVQLYNITQK